jgi:hypothetical protein
VGKFELAAVPVSGIWLDMRHFPARLEVSPHG